MHNSAKTPRKCSPILAVTCFKYNQEYFPSTPEQLKKKLILSVHFFSDRKTSTDLQTSAPKVPGLPGFLSILVHLQTVVLDYQGFPITIICSWMDKEDIR
jgi:hypothetical protein